MRLAVIFGILGTCWMLLAFDRGGWGWFFLWPGLSFLIIASAYAGLGAKVLGKRLDGTLSLPVVLLLLPYFLLTWITWALHGWLGRPVPCHEIVPGLWLGRRPVHRLPPGIGWVVDMTGEFWESATIRDGCDYLCLPTLDYHVPDEDAFRELVDRVAIARQPVYIHCAHGYGRAAMVTAAVLVRRGIASTPDEALRLLKQSRPEIYLAPSQRQLLARVAVTAH